jgi:integrase
MVTTNRAAIIQLVHIGQLIRMIHAYRGQETTEAALKLAPLLCVRSSELGAAEWRIPASRTKIGDERVVPLARQAFGILGNLKPITGGGRYVFTSLRGAHSPISENTVNFATRSMGYSGYDIAGTLVNSGGHPLVGWAACGLCASAAVVAFVVSRSLERAPISVVGVPTG